MLVLGSSLDVVSGSAAGADAAVAVLRGAALFLGADFFFGADFFAVFLAAPLAAFLAFLGAAFRAAFFAVFFEDFLAAIVLRGAAFLAFFLDLDAFDFFAFDLRAAMMILLTGLRAAILRRSRANEKPLNATALSILREWCDSSRVIHITSYSTSSA